MSLSADDQVLQAITTELGSELTTLRVLTRRDGRLVARATLQNGQELAVKASAQTSDFAAEAAAIDTLFAAGLPVSRVQVLHTTAPSILVVDWTPGRAIRADDTEPVRRQLLDVLARVHALPAQPPYGGVNPDLVTWIDGWSEHAPNWWTQQDGVLSAEGAHAETWYQQVRPLIIDRAGSLILLDAVPDHFIVGPDDQVRLIDAANLQPGDPVMDLALLHLHAPGLLGGLLEEYHQGEVTGGHLTQLLPYYVFLRALAAAEWHGSVLHDGEGAASWLRRAGPAHRSGLLP